MRSEKTRKFNGRTYRVSDLKEGPYKKKLVKGLMSARRDVGTALKKKDKKMERNARNRVVKYSCIIIMRTEGLQRPICMIKDLC